MVAVDIRVESLRALDGGAAVMVTVRLTEERADTDTDTDANANAGKSEKRCFRVLTQQFGALNCQVGPIDRETFDALEAAGQFSLAVDKGMRSLGYGACSGRELTRKLRMKGFSQEVASGAVAYLEKCGYIREDEDALRLCQRYREKGWGPRRIEAGLYEKGYSRESVRRVRELLENEDFVPDCLAMMKQKAGTFPDSREERQKLTGTLLRYGFGQNDIRRALELWCLESADNGEGT